MDGEQTKETDFILVGLLLGIVAWDDCLGYRLWIDGVMEFRDESKACSSLLQSLSGVHQESEAFQRLIAGSTVQCTTRAAFSNHFSKLWSLSTIYSAWDQIIRRLLICAPASLHSSEGVGCTSVSRKLITPALLTVLLALSTYLITLDQR